MLPIWIRTGPTCHTVSRFDQSVKYVLIRVPTLHVRTMGQGAGGWSNFGSSNQESKAIPLL
jgi:hypothetical protein